MFPGWHGSLWSTPEAPPHVPSTGHVAVFPAPICEGPRERRIRGVPAAADGDGITAAVSDEEAGGILLLLVARGNRIIINNNL